MLIAQYQYKMWKKLTSIKEDSVYTVVSKMSFKLDEGKNVFNHLMHKKSFL